MCMYVCVCVRMCACVCVCVCVCVHVCVFFLPSSFPSVFLFFSRSRFWVLSRTSDASDTATTIKSNQFQGSPTNSQKKVAKMFTKSSEILTLVRKCAKLI